MNLTVWAWVGLVILAVAPFGTYALGIHHGHAEGKHRRTCDNREAELVARHDEWLASMRAPWDEPVIRAKTGPLPKVPRLDHITAADLRDAVIVPEPKLTDTGELRALEERGAAIRRAMVTGEHAWRSKAGL